MVEVRGVGRFRKLYSDARGELEDRLRALVRAGKGSTFTAVHLRQVLVQVADAARGLEGDLFAHMETTGRVAANLAPRHLANMVGQLEGRYGRMTPVVQAAQAAVVRGVYRTVEPTLLDRYRSTSRLYGPQAISSIRQGLAMSIVQNETVDQAVERVSGTSGLFQAQRWRAERIVRTEMQWSYGVAHQRAMEELKPAVPKMRKRLVSTFDDRTGKDSKALNGQTVDVDQPFVWVVKDARGVPTGKVVRYMQPPNRPNDREVVIPWIDTWGAAGLAHPGPVEPTTAGLPS